MSVARANQVLASTVKGQCAIGDCVYEDDGGAPEKLGPGGIPASFWVNVNDAKLGPAGQLPGDIGNPLAVLSPVRAVTSWTGFNPFYESNWSIGKDGWVDVRCTAVGGVTVGGKSDCLQVTVDSTGGAQFLQKNSVTQAGEGAPYFEHRASVYIPSTNVGIDGVQLGLGALTQNFEGLAPDQWHELSIKGKNTNPAQTKVQIYFLDGSSTSVPVGDVVYIEYADTLLNQNYTVELQRDGDDAISGFAETELTDGTAEAWASAGGGSEDAFVRIQYDQTGNGNHSVQTDKAKMSKAISAGTLITNDNGIPTTEYDSSGPSTSPLPGLELLTNLDFYAVLKPSGTQYFLPNPSSTSGFGFIAHDGSSDTSLTASYGTPSLYVNGVSFAGSTRGDVWDEQNTHCICVHENAHTQLWSDVQISDGGYSDAWDYEGQIDCIIAYDSDQSANRTKIEGALADLFGISMEAPVESLPCRITGLEPTSGLGGAVLRPGAGPNGNDEIGAKDTTTVPRLFWDHSEMPSDAPFHIFCVGRCTNLGSTSADWRIMTSASGFDWRLAAKEGIGSHGLGVFITPDLFSASFSPGITHHIYELVVRPNGETLEHLLDNISRITTTAQATVVGGVGIILGGDISDNDRCAWSEAVVYPKALSASERTAAYNEIAARWGLPTI